ncbi:MAG: mechanosensitive ion channel domain-containing protein, partial [Planctomycetota bacterium]
MSTLASAPATNPVLDLITGHWVIFALVVIASVFILRVSDLLLLRRGKPSLERRLPRQITMLVLTLLAVIVVVLAIPDEESVAGGISDEARSSLLSLLGLGITALITLSSTTLAANAMSGIMLRATAPIRGGDWIRVGEHFGRVTERGLFHTEIQTEDRDLLSLPNLYLATNP